MNNIKLVLIRLENFQHPTFFYSRLGLFFGSEIWIMLTGGFWLLSLSVEKVGPVFIRLETLWSILCIGCLWLLPFTGSGAKEIFMFSSIKARISEAWLVRLRRMLGPVWSLGGGSIIVPLTSCWPSDKILITELYAVVATCILLCFCWSV